METVVTICEKELRIAKSSLGLHFQETGENDPNPVISRVIRIGNF